MKKRDKDRLRLWQDRLGRANAAYEPELSKMDGREELYQGCSRIRPIVCTAVSYTHLTLPTNSLV